MSSAFMKFIQTTCLFFILFFGFSGQNFAAAVTPEEMSLATQLTVITPQGKTVISRDDLTRLPQHELVTQTPWTTEKHRYRGVLMSDLLKAYHLAQYATLNAGALNNYQTKLTVDYLLRYPVLLAMQDNGVNLTPRNKGPLWIVFPLSDYPDLDVPNIHRMMVWQLSSLSAHP
jgi:hypothetical protein